MAQHRRRLRPPPPPVEFSAVPSFSSVDGNFPLQSDNGKGDGPEKTRKKKNVRSYDHDPDAERDNRSPPATDLENPAAEDGEEQKQDQEEDQEGGGGVIDDDNDNASSRSFSTFKITDPRALGSLFKENPPEIEGRRSGVLAGSLALVSLFAGLSRTLSSRNPLHRLGGKIRGYTQLGTSGGLTAALVVEALYGYYMYRASKKKQADYLATLKQIDRLYQKQQREEDMFFSSKRGDNRHTTAHSRPGHGQSPAPPASSSFASLRASELLLSKQQRHVKAQQKLFEALAIKNEPEVYGLTYLILFGVPLAYSKIFSRKKEEESLSSSSLPGDESPGGGGGPQDSSQRLHGTDAEERERRRNAAVYGRFIQGGIAIASALTVCWTYWKRWRYRKELQKLRQKFSSLRVPKERKNETEGNVKEENNTNNNTPKADRQEKNEKQGPTSTRQKREGLLD